MRDSIRTTFLCSSKYDETFFPRRLKTNPSVHQDLKHHKKQNLLWYFQSPKVSCLTLKNSLFQNPKKKLEVCLLLCHSDLISLYSLAEGNFFVNGEKHEEQRLKTFPVSEKVIKFWFFDNVAFTMHLKIFSK